MAHPKPAKPKQETFEELKRRIGYSDKYNDDEYEYRHVTLPLGLFKMIPKPYFNPDKSGTLKLLSEDEWRSLGIAQSIGWEHYEVHAPEPHVLLFRRALAYTQARPRQVTFPARVPRKK